MSMLALVCAACAADAAPPRAELNLEPWRRMVVHAEGSRIKPFDTFARETCIELFGRAFFSRQQSVAPKVFETVAAEDVKDWPALAAALAAPAADAPNAPPRADGRTDRFKAGDPGDPSPLARLRELLSVEDRKLLRDTDFKSEPALRQALKVAEDAALAARRKVFPRGSDEYSLDDTRVAAADQKQEEALAALAAYDAAKAKWLPVPRAQARLLTVFNAILGFANFHEAAAWNGAALPTEAREILQAGPPAKLPAERLHRLNRFLLSSALPAALAPPGRPGTADPVAMAYDPTEACLALMFSWQGWDAAATGSVALDVRHPLEAYYQNHQADGWDRLAWIPAGHGELVPFLKPETDLLASVRAALRNELFREHVAASYARYQRETERATEKFQDKSRVLEKLPNAEQRAIATVSQAESFQRLRMGLALGVAPPGDPPAEADLPPEPEARKAAQKQAKLWIPLFALVAGDRLPAPYGTAGQAGLKKSFLDARAAFLRRDAARFDAATLMFMNLLEPHAARYAARLKEDGAALNLELASAKKSDSGLGVFDKLDEGKDWDRFPDAALIDKELFYNRFDPFWKAFWLAAAGFFVGLLGLAVRPKVVFWCGYALLLAAIAAMAWGLVQRSQISGRAPVVEFFDTVVWAGTICGGLGAAMGWRWPIAALVTSALLAVFNSVSVNLPLEFGVGMRPIQPVLRSEKWLYIHVMTIVASYGAFALAWLLALVGLGFHLFGAEKSPHCKALGLMNYRSMLVGVLLLATGTFLGGWWASDAWGRFWGWDPKETFALVALLAYLAVLHARFVGVKNYGTMVGSALAFTMVVASWYGVNFILKAGKHAYAFNTGGQWFVIGAVLANAGFLGLVHVVKASRASVAGAESAG